MRYRIAPVLLVVAAATACSSITNSPYSSPRMGPSDAYTGSSYRDSNGGFYTAPASYAPPLDQKRKVDEQDCSKPLSNSDGNLRCK